MSKIRIDNLIDKALSLSLFNAFERQIPAEERKMLTEHGVGQINLFLSQMGKLSSKEKSLEKTVTIAKDKKISLSVPFTHVTSVIVKDKPLKKVDLSKVFTSKDCFSFSSSDRTVKINSSISSDRCIIIGKGVYPYIGVIYHCIYRDETGNELEALGLDKVPDGLEYWYNIIFNPNEIDFEQDSVKPEYLTYQLARSFARLRNAPFSVENMQYLSELECELKNQYNINISPNVM